MTTSPSHTLSDPPDARAITLLELLDRLLDKGVVVRGDVTLSVAGVDLIVLDLAVLLASVERAAQLLVPAARREEAPRRLREWPES